MAHDPEMAHHSAVAHGSAAGAPGAVTGGRFSISLKFGHVPVQALLTSL
jgi:hypothetical protein